MKIAVFEGLTMRVILNHNVSLAKHFFICKFKFIMDEEELTDLELSESDVSDEDFTDYEESDEESDSEIERAKDYAEDFLEQCNQTSYPSSNGPWKASQSIECSWIPLEAPRGLIRLKPIGGLNPKKELIRIEGIEGTERDFFYCFISGPIIGGYENLASNLAPKIFYRIVRYTNLEIDRLSSRLRKKGRSENYLKLLSPTNIPEILAFIGLRMHFGLSGLKDLALNDIFSTKRGIASIGDFLTKTDQFFQKRT